MVRVPESSFDANRDEPAANEEALLPRTLFGCATNPSYPNRNKKDYL
jgi:hypothetical protein